MSFATNPAAFGSGIAGRPPVTGERRIAGPLVSFDIPLETARVRAEPAYAAEGHSARTLAKYPDLRVVLVAMKAGTKIAVHETAERLALQVLLGRARLRLDDEERAECGAGSFVAVDAARAHEIECLDDCAFLLTVAWPPERAPAAGDYDPIDV